MSRFRENAVVYCNDAYLLDALYRRLKNMGWKDPVETTNYNTRHSPLIEEEVKWLKLENDVVSFHNHPCDGVDFFLPEDWNHIIKIASRENSYRVGGIFINSIDEKYILAQISSGVVALISLSTGNRYQEGIKVEHIDNIPYSVVEALGWSGINDLKK